MASKTAAILTAYEAEQRKQYAATAIAALEAYEADRGSLDALNTASWAVECYREHYGPLLACGYLWTVDQSGELLRMKADGKKRAS